MLGAPRQVVRRGRDFVRSFADRLRRTRDAGERLLELLERKVEIGPKRLVRVRQAIGHAECEVFLREFRYGDPEPLDRCSRSAAAAACLPGVRLALCGGGGARLGRLRFDPLSFDRMVLEDLHGRGHSADFVAPPAVLDLDSEVPTGQVAPFGRQAATTAGRSSGR